MKATTKTYRYQFPKKAIKSDCPQCGPRYNKTLSRYVDTQTDELLPESYGRCDRESNCGYHLSPYHKTEIGQSYANMMYQLKSHYNSFSTLNAKSSRTTHSSSPMEKYHIPDEVFVQSLKHYERNHFARLLNYQFGASSASDLLNRFQVGTSGRWPGACVFWFIDEQNLKRGGQIKLFDLDWHTEKYTNREGKQCSKTSWVHSALKYRFKKSGHFIPDWLIAYEEKAECVPCLFGLPQLLTTPKDKPIAIVEAPKTAIVCSYYLQDFVWLAVGSKSYLNARRLAPVRGRTIMLYPDLNALSDWCRRAEELRANGFDVEVSDYLESHADEGQRMAGLDLADYLLQQPPNVSKLDKQKAWASSVSILKELHVEPLKKYPREED